MSLAPREEIAVAGLLLPAMAAGEDMLVDGDCDEQHVAKNSTFGSHGSARTHEDGAAQMK